MKVTSIIREMLNFAKHLFIFSLLLTTQFVWAASDKRFALVRSIQGTEFLSPGLAKEMRTVSLRVLGNQKGYHLLLAGDDPPIESNVNIFSIESEVGKDGKNYFIETRLVDLKKKSTVTKAMRKDVREEDLLRLFKAAIESLFIDDPVLNKEKTPALPVVKENENSVSVRLPPVRNTLTTQGPNSSALDFRKRILEMKGEADVGIRIAKEEAKKENDITHNKAQIKSSDLINQSNHLVSEKESLQDIAAQKTFKSLPSYIHLGYEAKNVDTNYLLSTTTRVQLLNINFQGNYPFKTRLPLALTYNASYSRPISAPIALPSLYSADVRGAWVGNTWNTTIGVSYETSFFSNISTPGEGLISYDLNMAWANIGSEFRLNFKRPWLVGLDLGIPIYASTSHPLLKKQTQWSGLKYQVSAVPPLSYKGWTSKLSLEQKQISSPGDLSFTQNEFRFGLFARRSI